MKKLIILLSVLTFFTACSVTKEAKISRAENRQNQKLVTAALVKDAVESRKFIVRLDRLYPTGGGMVELRPRSNYIVIDGNIASVRAAYLGRQYDIRPIAGIRLVSRANDYSINKNFDKQEYKITMKVTQGGDTFDIYLDINKSGKCYASVSSIKIDIIRYSGELVPIPNSKPEESSEERVI